LKQSTRASECTSATTGIFPKARERWGFTARRSFSFRLPTKGHADYLWELEQRAHAVANGYFVGTINRVGREAPWKIGEFFGSSYFCNPDGRILAKGSEDRDELIVADLDLDQIKEVRTHWQFYRDRRPDMYGPLCGQ